MKILVFDNYDSFTYNLVHLVQQITHGTVDVIRNDQIDLDKVNDYDKIILSPGPGIPKEAGMLLPLIKKYAPEKSILGVCLGHQAIGEAFGGTLVNLENVYHGVASEIVITGTGQEARSQGKRSLFEGLPVRFNVGRYHSWILREDNLPEELVITARDENGYIMALQHKNYDVAGVQFHPESVLTPDGEAIMKNWLNA